MFSNKTVAAFDSAQSFIFGTSYSHYSRAISTKHKGVSRNVSMSNNEITKISWQDSLPTHYELIILHKISIFCKLKNVKKNWRKIKEIVVNKLVHNFFHRIFQRGLFIIISKLSTAILANNENRKEIGVLPGFMRLSNDRR